MEKRGDDNDLLVGGGAAALYGGTALGQELYNRARDRRLQAEAPKTIQEWAERMSKAGVKPGDVIMTQGGWQRGPSHSALLYEGGDVGRGKGRMFEVMPGIASPRNYIEGSVSDFLDRSLGGEEAHSYGAIDPKHWRTFGGVYRPTKESNPTALKNYISSLLSHDAAAEMEGKPYLKYDFLHGVLKRPRINPLCGGKASCTSLVNAATEAAGGTSASAWAYSPARIKSKWQEVLKGVPLQSRRWGSAPLGLVGGLGLAKGLAEGDTATAVGGGALAAAAAAPHISSVAADAIDSLGGYAGTQASHLAPNDLWKGRIKKSFGPLKHVGAMAALGLLAPALLT
jgi:hypothetical protein